MSAEWYYTRGKERVGPLSSKQLKALAARNEVRPDDLLWTDGMSEGVPASIVGLFPPKGATPVPPPVPSKPSSPSLLQKGAGTEMQPRPTRPRRRAMPTYLLVGAGCTTLVLVALAALFLVPKGEGNGKKSPQEQANKEFGNDKATKAKTKSAPETPVPSADNSDSEERRLQGNWTTTHEEFNGTVLSKQEVTMKNRLMSVKGDQITIIRTEKGDRGRYSGRFNLDPSRSPKTFDFTGVGPRGNPVKLKGIYAFEGDTLKLCYRLLSGQEENELGRPDSFSATEGSKVQLYHFMKASGAMQQGLTSADVVGVWQHKAGESEPQELTLLINGKINDLDGNCTWTFDGVTLTMRWPNEQAPDGVWIDQCKVSQGGRTFQGTNQIGLSISGKKVSDVVP